MPPKKPAALVQKNETKFEENQRISQEKAVTSDNKLPTTAPKELKGHATAREVWRRLVRQDNKLESPLMSGQDRDVLIDLCLATEEKDELAGMRRSAYEDWLARREDVSAHRKTMREMPKALREANFVDLEKEAIQLVNSVQAAYKTVLEIDARMDQKKKLIAEYLRQLYLTPMSRAKAVPNLKDAQAEEVDEMEALLSTPAGQLEAMVNASRKAEESDEQ